MLRAFAAVARTGSFQKASELLGIRQPAVSDAIRRLEGEAGSPVFRRDHTGAHLTDMGLRLLPDAQAAIDAADQFDALLKEGCQELTIGFMGEAAGRQTSALMELVQAEADVGITLRRYDYADPTCGLASGETDIAIIWPPLAAPSLRILPLGSDRRAIAVPVGDPLARRARLDPQAVADRVWVVPQSADRTWRDFRHPGEVGVDDVAGTVPSRSIEETLELVALGRGIALVSESTDQHYARANVVIVPLAADLRCSTALAWRKADRRSVINRIVDASHVLTAASALPVP